MVWCVWWVAVAGALLALPRDARADRHSHIVSPLPFVLGSRYGRSPDRVMAPRNDRFFMGSRYGKRAEVVPDDVVAQWEGAERAPGGGERAQGGGQAAQGVGELYCQYTGVVTLYRCTAADTYNRSEDRSSSEDRD